MTMKYDLEVTGVVYTQTPMGTSYRCTTNVDGVTIHYTSIIGITFIEGTWSKIKHYQHLTEAQLENLIDKYEETKSLHVNELNSRFDYGN